MNINPQTGQPNNGFTLTTSYALGPGDEQLTEINGQGSWQHTNVWAGGKLLATYDSTGIHFYLDDPLGTRRVQTNYQGGIEQSCRSLPYGNGESCMPTPTEHLFTGKERDAESGNDYFGARYYASSMGRFLSPDPVIITPLRLVDPQRLNLYGYGRNNPLSYIDPRGQDITMVNDTDEGRKLALQKITKRMSTAEAANIDVKMNKHGKWEAFVKDKSAIDMKHASVEYKGVVGVIGDHSVNVNYGLVGDGLTATYSDLGKVSSISMLDWTTGTPGDRNVDVIVTNGETPANCCEEMTPFGTIRVPIPDDIAAYHEVVGETLKFRAGHANLLNDPFLDSSTVIKIENELRDSLGMYPRTGSDHGPPVITVNGGSTN